MSLKNKEIYLFSQLRFLGDGLDLCEIRLLFIPRGESVVLTQDLRAARKVRPDPCGHVERKLLNAAMDPESLWNLSFFLHNSYQQLVVHSDLPW